MSSQTNQNILEFAKQYGFARVTCQCPFGQHSKRKQAKELMKTLEEVFPNARANLAQAALTYGSQKAYYSNRRS